MEIKTIKVSEKDWKKLMRWRMELGCKNLKEVVERILAITFIDDIKKEGK